MMDYVDRNVPMLAKMFDKRMHGYQAMGYSVDDHASPKHENNNDLEQLEIALAGQPGDSKNACPPGNETQCRKAHQNAPSTDEGNLAPTFEEEQTAGAEKINAAEPR